MTTTPTLPIRERINKQGQRSFVLDFYNEEGQRIRISRRHRSQVESLAAQLVYEKRSRTSTLKQFIALAQQQQDNLLWAHDRSQRLNTDLRAIIRYYERHVPTGTTPKEAPTAAAAVSEWIRTPAFQELRPRTKDDYTYRLKRFTKTFLHRHLDQITPREIKRWLDKPISGTGTPSPENPAPPARTRRNFLKPVSSLFAFAQAEGWIQENPCRLVAKPTFTEALPGIFSVEETRKILETSVALGIGPVAILGFFAGVGESEVLRLTWKDIQWDAQEVTIDANQARNKEPRSNALYANTLKWLTRIAVKTGPLCDPHTYFPLRRKLRTAVAKWPHNGICNSFASYHFKCFGDDTLTGKMLGVHTPDRINRYFRAPVTQKAAGDFWSIVPGPPKHTPNGPNLQSS